MRRFESILFYSAPGESLTDGLKHAFELARRNDCSLTLLGVVEPVSRLLSHVLPGQQGMEALILDSQRRQLAELAELPDAEGLEITTRIRRGRPFLEIIGEVLEHKHDLVVKSAQGDAASGGTLGPTALHLLRKCPCPVWVIKPGSGGFRRIVAAVDPEQEDAHQQTLQRNIVELGSSLASIYGAELSVVHAWSLEGETLLRRRMPVDELQDAINSEEERARANLMKLAEETSLDPECLRLIKGFHGAVIAEHLRESEADLVVMGTLSRTGVAGLIIGNTAERILKGLDCSVLALKPDDFISPVTQPVPAV